ncbi:MAG: Hsp20/alpha crystallin family protein [Syntrophales bacterium]|jgi:HSP20 family protein|nr:Hsp20/alpha crystallin family protein [Syntrophales bacterium]MCK9528336.1 Hsp20/alpha crystallin family protein [Syntrophales bacterium]MDX9922175.1 Hsp20/alpha crystallin family protein [Syntrophales bacterium]
MDFIKIRFSDERRLFDVEGHSSLSEAMRFFDPALTVYRRIWRPAVDIYESPELYTVIVELPGVRNEDLHLEIDSRTVRIHGSREERIRAGQCRYRLAEITYGNFERTLTLAVPVDVDGVEATLSGGFLEIRIPKIPPASAVCKVSIGSH